MDLREAEKEMTLALTPRFGSAEANAIARLYLRERPLGDTRSADIERMISGEPVQYVLGTAHFYGLDLYVDRSVLIPRSETEELVHWIIADESARNPALRSDSLVEQFRIMDVGTGSGCIALALKKHLKGAEVWGCDKSDDALGVARRNASELDIRVDFQALNFLDGTERRQLPVFNVIVSNPPYIPASEGKNMHEHVTCHEPHLALFVPDDDPMLFYRNLARFGQHHLVPHGCIYMEIHEDHGPDTCEVFHHYGYNGISLRKDMQGKDRMLKVDR